ncbi:hypothetical protein SCWH03_46010 [Streptomyces pacificus]|uniref:Uncharacterized protein n=1 Tax=Streptomyces pacificus TaxID=2705029 RepID=A0A6A0AZH3_9ACTN|nr:hypothetical protein SCWH03_46010 [Streptomyces pacificus]
MWVHLSALDGTAEVYPRMSGIRSDMDQASFLTWTASIVGSVPATAKGAEDSSTRQETRT